MADRIPICPRCGSMSIGSFAGGISGMYKCEKCGYIGSLIADKDIVKK